MPTMQNSTECCRRFAEEYKKKTGRGYSKADKQLYKQLCEHGDECEAIKRAKDKLNEHKRNNLIKPSDKCPATTVYRLVEAIREKVPCK